jgi:hypothetical protein
MPLPPKNPDRRTLWPGGHHCRNHVPISWSCLTKNAALDALFGQINTDELPWSTLPKQIAVSIGALRDRWPSTKEADKESK